MKWTTLLFSITVSQFAFSNANSRPFLPVPNLTEIRNILSQLEAPIVRQVFAADSTQVFRFTTGFNVSAITERINLSADPAIYEDGGKRLLGFIHAREIVADASGRFKYGKLEYPFTLPLIFPDHATQSNPFPPGRFHQDTFSGNANLTSFYVNTLVPEFFTSQTSYFFHLDNSTVNNDAAMNLDATLLALLSHRAHIGKIVAETKFASNVTGYTPLIQSNNSEAIRTLLTNTTQETGVLAQASNAADEFSTAWIGSGALVPGAFAGDLRNATARLFRELIDLTTEVEVQYVSEKLTHLVFDPHVPLL
ncbi:hypothetical protein EW146_g511 [Bondarzewia mesenterica]|uniref:Chorismate mutase n=1 Tax=Bondarzewia mesenterica TaxID=1095465 RepID=A0A4S4M701_9AGAM|nr:hypothetical protein EW146_g511 [Bondarzewia mesenterica]